MISAGQVGAFPVSVAGGTNPTGMGPVQTPSPLFSAGTCTWAGMGAAAVASMASSICGMISTDILADAQKRQWDSQGRIADTQMNMALDQLNAKEKSMQLTVELTRDVRNKASVERAAVEAQYKEVKAQLAEEKKTREATKVDLKRLDRIFARNDRFYGKPVSSAKPAFMYA